MRRITIWLLLAFLVPAFNTAYSATTPASAVNQAVFTSVKGKVQVRKKAGQKPRTVQKDSTALEGETILTGPDSRAALRLVDGSELKVDPKTTFRLTKLQTPTLKDKIFRFKLLVGKLFAKVKKLASSKSSFEIEAGGVVCGVRGTEYSMFYDPNTGKVDVLVLDGTVWAASGGQTQVFGPGQGGTFLNGGWELLNPPSGSSAQGFNGFDPFYGFNGNATDDFGTVLTDLSGGVGDVTGRVSDDGIAGLGSHTLVLQLGFPQYP